MQGVGTKHNKNKPTARFCMPEDRLCVRSEPTSPNRILVGLILMEPSHVQRMCIFCHLCYTGSFATYAYILTCKGPIGICLAFGKFRPERLSVLAIWKVAEYRGGLGLITQHQKSAALLGEKS